MRPETRLSRWIERRGASNVARGLSSIGVAVTPRAVYSWMYGQARPRPTHAGALVRLSRGELSLEQIYAPARTPGEEQTR
jgi:hypothetical protein